MIGFIGDANLWLSLILVVLYFVRFRKYGWDYKYFNLFLLNYAVITICMWSYVILTEGGNNLFFFLPYLVFEFITLLFFYSEVLENKKIRFLLLPVLLFFAIQNGLNPGLINHFNELGAFVSHSVLISLSLFYMYKCLSKAGPFSVINLGIFLYFIPVTLVFVFGNFLNSDEFHQRLSLLFNNIHDVIYLLFQSLIFVEWWRNFYRVKTN